MKSYDKNKESKYIQYCNVNNLFGRAMSRKLPVNNFEWMKDTSQFNEDFIKNYNEENDEGYFLEVDVQYLEKLQEVCNDLSFLLERIIIELNKKLVVNLQSKTEYTHKKFKTSTKSWISFLKKVIKFNKNVWLKPYIDMNTDLRKKTKIDFEKDFFILMNNAVSGKSMENVRKHRDIKLVTTERRRHYLVSKANRHDTKFFT